MKIKTFIISIIFAINLAYAGGGEEIEYIKQKWSFDGPFGTVDRQSAQRGYVVYKEVCAACHSLDLIAYRNLESLGFSAQEVKAIAANDTITDGPNDEGEMFERPGLPFDHFAGPYPNDKAAKAANNNAMPPDLSLIVKARLDGANYLYSLLNGYNEPPVGFELSEGLYYNKYFSGNQIAMPSPLSDGIIEYQDGTNATVSQMARDVVNFLQWAAEPEMEQRKRMGVKVLVYLLIFTVLFYLAKKKIWSRLKD